MAKITPSATVVPNPAFTACSWSTPGSPTPKFYKGETVIASATLSNSYGRCGDNGVREGYNRVLTQADVNTTLSGIKVTATCTSNGPAESTTCPAEKVGDGKIGGGIDTPYEPPPQSGGGATLPDAGTLEDLDGILYLNGKGPSNKNNLQCTNQGRAGVNVYYCDYTNGNCTPTAVCTESLGTIQDNFRCALNGISFVGTNCGWGTAQCEYKIKIKFEAPSGRYPTGCKLD